MALDRDFERFNGGPNEPIANRVHVTISPAKLILLNRRAYQLMGTPEAVNLYYSRVRDTIAIEPTSPRFNQAFPVAATGASFRINAAPFCRNFNIKIDATLKFPRPDLKGHTMLLNLSETISVSRQKRKKK
ncbi:MAG: hypothetical protein IPM59_02610 [Chloracidobacterium sp.]|nr:hypothetical protein [Chloracidobacterium sp.]